MRTASTLVFACYSKACAPPPAGRGGSTPGTRAAIRVTKQRALKALSTIGASKADLDGPAAKLYGKGEDAVFRGAATTTAPFPRARRSKTERQYDADAVRKVLDGPVLLRKIDPRALKATQPMVTREGVRFYMGNEYKKTGRTFADQGDKGNAFPVVYFKKRTQEWVIVSGHHRATAALAKGEPLEARVVYGP